MRKMPNGPSQGAQDLENSKNLKKPANSGNSTMILPQKQANPHISGENPDIFGAIAPFFWAKNMPAMPLRFHDKRPVEFQWSQWSKTMPDANLQKAWLQRHMKSNIGMPAGVQSRCVFLDVDNPDPRIDSLLKSLLPQSPWIRIGQKGYVAAYKFTPDHASAFKIKDAEGNNIIEFLSTGNQVVLPPSIHPQTQQPYTETAPLHQLVDELPVLPSNLESLLRESFKQAGFDLSHTGLSQLTSYVPAGSRDNTMVSMAGLFSMDITRGHLSLQQALDRMEAWYESLTEKVEGDALDIDKGKYKILEFLQRDVLGDKARPLPLGWDSNLQSPFKEEVQQIFKKDHEEWSPVELQKYVYAEFAQHPDRNDPQRLQTIEYALTRMSRSPSWTSLQREQFLKYLVESGRVAGMTPAVLKKRLKDLESGDVEGTDHTEIAEAVIEDLERFGELKFHLQSIWQWKGAQWDTIPETEILRHIAIEYGHLAAAKRQSDHSGIVKVLKNLLPQGLATSTVPGINFANYFLTLTGEKCKHKPEFGATYTLPYRHVPEQSTSAPMFQKLLFDAWGHDADYMNKTQALREFIAVTLMGIAPRYQRCLLLYGTGSTGKTTILNVIKSLFPEETRSVVPPDSWADKYAPNMMVEKLLNIAGELSEKAKIDGKTFKQVIDGSEMFTQDKHKPLFKFHPKAAHWFASNYLPRTDDTSAGFNRRWLILEFNKPVETRNKIVALDEKIVSEEREAIVAWALESLPKLQERNDYTIPFSSELLINEMACENNSVRYFLTECPKIQTEGKLRLKAIEDLICGDGDTPSTMSPEFLMSQWKNQTIYNPSTGTCLSVGDPFPTEKKIPPSSSSEAETTPQESMSLQVLEQNVVSPTNGGKTSLNSKSAILSGMSSASLNAIQSSLSLSPGEGKTLNGLNPISEDQMHKTYLEFCSQQGTARPVGLRMFKKYMMIMKHEMGYDVQTLKTNLGAEKHFYTGITLAGV